MNVQQFENNNESLPAEVFQYIMERCRYNIDNLLALQPNDDVDFPWVWTFVFKKERDDKVTYCTHTTMRNYRSDTAFEITSGPVSEHKSFSELAQYLLLMGLIDDNQARRSSI